MWLAGRSILFLFYAFHSLKMCTPPHSLYSKEIMSSVAFLENRYTIIKNSQPPTPFNLLFTATLYQTYINQMSTYWKGDDSWILTHRIGKITISSIRESMMLLFSLTVLSPLGSLPDNNAIDMHWPYSSIWDQCSYPSYRHWSHSSVNVSYPS